MAESRPFCFLRMGDMDLAYLLAIQEGRLAECPCDDGPTNGTMPYGNPGLGPAHAARYWDAFRDAEYVDNYERYFPSEHWLPRLALPRTRHGHGNPNRETLVIVLTWLETEFKGYCEQHRVGIAGAEARLLELLSSAAGLARGSAAMVAGPGTRVLSPGSGRWPQFGPKPGANQGRPARVRQAERSRYVILVPRRRCEDPLL